MADGEINHDPHHDAEKVEHSNATNSVKRNASKSANKKDSKEKENVKAVVDDGKYQQVVFHIGDRVVLQGPVKMKRLNGGHGLVAREFNEKTGRYICFMDLLDPLPVVKVKPANLLKVVTARSPSRSSIRTVE